MLLDAENNPVARPIGEKGIEPDHETALRLTFHKTLLFLSFKDKLKPTFVDENAT